MVAPVSPTFRTFATAAEAVRALSDAVVERLGRSVVDRGSATLVLSGGSTPVKLFADLVGRHRDSLKWDRIDVFWADERAVGPEDPQSNYSLARGTLLAPIGIPEHRWHRIQGEFRPLEDEARRYGAEISERFAKVRPEQPWWDVVLLGMGPDGHTASLFPGSPTLARTEGPLVLVDEHPGQDPKVPRISMSLRALGRSAYTAFLVLGADKAPAFDAVRSGRATPPILPAARVSAMGPVDWYVDRLAASV